MNPLENTIMPYAWGSRTAISDLLGKPPADKPEAEMWMGAHPLAPSRIDGKPLDALILESPEPLLGARVHELFGPKLPFLLKVLAAGEPLSLQAHPTMARAQLGFAEEEKRGIPRDAPHRNYKDASHKPELLCALGPFDALSGFRSMADARQIFEPLGAIDLLKGSMEETFRFLMTHPEKSSVVDRVVKACGASPECTWARRLAAMYPGDIGVVCSLLLELVHLEAGEAIYLGAGNLHAYLEGTGIEIMASSDNVLRGGLTKKHIDVPELLDVLDFEATPPSIVKPRTVDAFENAYDTPAQEFRLSTLRVGPEGVERETSGPEILLVTEGTVTSGELSLQKGQAAFVPAEAGKYQLKGEGIVYRASTNLLA